MCDYEKAISIDYEDRLKKIPHSKSNNGIGHGQSSLWYASEAKDSLLKNKLIDYIEDLVDGASANDEVKYHIHDESKTCIVTSSQIHRSQAARAECISLYGCHCNICGFDFEKTYGEIGKCYIEVHHITPIEKLSTAEDYAGTNPKTDLIPLCSNCHSMIHRKKEPYRPGEIKKMLKDI